MRVMFVGSVHTINTSVETYLTRGKWYETESKFQDNLVPPTKYYIVTNNYGQSRRYKAEYFMTLEQVRDNKLTDLGI
jgi:hypothetical protein